MDDNGRKVFGITLSDIYLRYGLEVKQPAPNPTDPTLFFKPAGMYSLSSLCSASIYSSRQMLHGKVPSNSASIVNPTTTAPTRDW